MVLLCKNNPIFLWDINGKVNITMCKYYTMTSSNRNIYRVNGPLRREVTGECPSQRPETQSFHVFFDLHLHKRLSNQPWRRWFEPPLRSLWCHCNALSCFSPIALTSSVYSNASHEWTNAPNTFHGIYYLKFYFGFSIHRPWKRLWHGLFIIKHNWCDSKMPC